MDDFNSLLQGRLVDGVISIGFSLALFFLIVFHLRRKYKQLQVNKESVSYLLKKYPQIDMPGGEKNLFKLINDTHVPLDDRERLSSLYDTLQEMANKVKYKSPSEGQKLQ